MNDIITQAQRVFDLEIAAVREVKNKIDTSFSDAIELLFNSSGKVIVTGMGKSGRIAEKISATLASTGTPSVYLHPSEAAHGDLGMMSANDILVTIGKSGESEELTTILPIVRKMGIKIISLVGNLNSTVAQLSDINIDIAISKEACDLKLAPTSSTTASLVMGDAIAMVLMKLKNFKSEDFALFHPSGQLGKRLLMTVSDIMRKGSDLPIINSDDKIENLIYLMSKYGLGIVGVCKPDSQLVGIITDGDLRRALQNHGASFFDKNLMDICTTNPLTIEPHVSAYDALVKMEKERTLNHLPVIENNRFIGMLSLHDLIKAGI
jgi:arabinose-5-phosphate isomerase